MPDPLEDLDQEKQRKQRREGRASQQELKANGADPSQETAVSLADFRAYMPDHRYIFMPTNDLWPASSVDARVRDWPKKPSDNTPMRPSDYIDRHAPVEQLTWVPGEPRLIEGRLIDGGGWIERSGCTAFNLYRPPTLQHGNPHEIAPWLAHLNRIYPDDADHIVRWLAQRIQQPGIKINHALVLGGLQGIGKDTLLEPAKQAIGPWNFNEVSPVQLLGRFNGFAKSVILRMSEARDLGDTDRFALYDHMKVYTAAPPDVLRCDEKNIREHSVLNVCGVVITTNHRTDGLFLPSDDRRHYVAWSDASKSEFDETYWTKIWRWYADGGIGNVAAYLAQLDLANFDPKAPPPKTEAFWTIVNAARAPEEAELADIIDSLGKPEAVTLDRLIIEAEVMKQNDLALWLRDRKNRRLIPHRLEAVDYEPVRNDTAEDGLWKINGRRQAVYAQKNLALSSRLKAAQKLAGR